VVELSENQPLKRFPKGVDLFAIITSPFKLMVVGVSRHTHQKPFIQF